MGSGPAQAWFWLPLWLVHSLPNCFHLVFAMAEHRRWLWCLVWVALLHAVFAGPPGQGRHHTGYGSSSSKGRWGQSGHWNWQQSQPHYTQPTEVVVRVEDGKRSKKEKAKKKKKHSTSTSSSRSESTDSRAKSKRHSKSKRKASQSVHELGQKDVEELQQFRRQAEIQKLREKILASIPSMSSKNVQPAKPDGEAGDTTAEALSPKTKKVVLAQSRILGQDSVSKRLLTDEVVSWMDVKAQLIGQSAQDIKSLCKQICEHAPRNKSDCITKIMDQLQSLD